MYTLKNAVVVAKEPDDKLYSWMTGNEFDLKTDVHTSVSDVEVARFVLKQNYLVFFDQLFLNVEPKYADFPVMQYQFTAVEDLKMLQINKIIGMLNMKTVIV